jgi:hypothetical protein
MTTLETLKSLHACSGATDWVAAQPGQSPAALWATCKRGDWMWWWLRNRPGGVSKETSEAFARWCSEMAKAHAGEYATAAAQAEWIRTNVSEP